MKSPHATMIITTPDRFLLTRLQMRFDYNATSDILDSRANDYYTVVILPTSAGDGSKEGIDHALLLSRTKNDIDKMKMRYPAIDIKYGIGFY